MRCSRPAQSPVSRRTRNSRRSSPRSTAPRAASPQPNSVRLSAENTAIVLDSTADFPDAESRFASWRVVPLYIRFGDESYRDYIELGPAEFYARLRSTAVLPTTSQPTPADFLAAYEELADFECIYSLHIAG